MIAFLSYKATHQIDNLFKVLAASLQVKGTGQAGATRS